MMMKTKMKGAADSYLHQFLGFSSGGVFISQISTQMLKTYTCENPCTRDCELTDYLLIDG